FQDGLHLLTRQMPEQWFVKALAGDGQDTLGLGQVAGITSGGVAQEGAESSQAQVARSWGIAASFFQVLQEGQDCGRVEIRQGKGRAFLPPTLMEEAQQQPEGVPVRSDRAVTGILLLHETLAEKVLDQGSERWCGMFAFHRW